MTQDSKAEAPNTSTAQALESRALAPRFYTTNCKEIGEYDIEPVRSEWDAMMAAFDLDTNREHFNQNYDFDPADLDADPELKAEFLQVYFSSLFLTCITNYGRMMTRFQILYSPTPYLKKIL